MEYREHQHERYWVDLTGTARYPRWRTISSARTGAPRRFCTLCRKLRVCFFDYDETPRCQKCSEREGRVCRFSAWPLRDVAPKRQPFTPLPPQQLKPLTPAYF